MPVLNQGLLNQGANLGPEGIYILKDNYANIVVDPDNNYVRPDKPEGEDDIVDITWFGLSDPDSKVVISSTGWTGSGILIVEGNLRITGGTFSRIIYVTGTCVLDVTGNASITGEIYVEGDVDIRGNPQLTYDTNAITDALGYFSEEGVYNLIMLSSNSNCKEPSIYLCKPTVQIWYK